MIFWFLISLIHAEHVLTCRFSTALQEIFTKTSSQRWDISNTDDYMLTKQSINRELPFLKQFNICKLSFVFIHCLEFQATICFHYHPPNTNCGLNSVSSFFLAMNTGCQAPKLDLVGIIPCHINSLAALQSNLMITHHTSFVLTCLHSLILHMFDLNKVHHKTVFSEHEWNSVTIKLTEFDIITQVEALFRWFSARKM